MHSTLRNCVLQDRRVKGGWAGGCRDRDKPQAERKRERDKRWMVVIEEGVCCSSMADKCHTLRQGLSRSKLAHSQIWVAAVLNHPRLGAGFDR